MARQLFYVQEYPRGVWHVESRDDPEIMLCGLKILVELDSVKIQGHWGLKRCLWCEHNLDELSSSPSSLTFTRSERRISPTKLMTRLRDVTTRGGSTSSGSPSPGPGGSSGGSPGGGLGRET